MPRKAESASAPTPRSGSSRSGAGLNSQTMGWAMVLLRIFVGAKFLQDGIGHWSWIGTYHLEQQLMRWTAGPNPAALSSYVVVLRQFLLPHASAFTYLLVFGEILIGVFLILGLLTRLMTLPALLFSMHFLLATWNLGPEWQGINEALLVMELALLLTGAGRLCGIDMALARKRPQWPLW